MIQSRRDEAASRKKENYYYLLAAAATAVPAENGNYIASFISSNGIVIK